LADFDITYREVLADDVLQKEVLAKTKVLPIGYILDSNGTIVEVVAGGLSYEEWSVAIDATLKKLEK